ncbi:hypothetical protein VSDG_03517 [Cytospora chrysosperma]|uniref:D-isomer specific 2-hydroxyacid dehydrogenase NAD-binding domain-containing protein n=1 Tax=Cytospora chrysosperma TaxID=252740 RepID=A0A423W9T7_CYTCH|nr:hypothetical protein VSDG_03517 [Valsa sordida]
MMGINDRVVTMAASGAYRLLSGVGLVTLGAPGLPRRHARTTANYCVPGTGDPDGPIPTKLSHGTSTDDINSFLDQDLDILVLSLPLTSETHGIISHEQFRILSKKQTFLSSIARGGSINTEALMQALETGQITGAAVDGAGPEPLPSDHPLWNAPNLLIRPHVSWQTHLT